MNVRLEARVPVVCHVIHAKVSRSADLPYMMPVLEHVGERRGAATAASMSAELFISPPLCRSLLAYCVENGLAEEVNGRHALTADGARALERGLVLTSAEGMWKVYVAGHAAIPKEMSVVRIEDGASDAGYQPGKERDRQPRVKDTVPAVRALKGRDLRPALGTMGAVIMRDVHRYEKQIAPDLDVRLLIEPGRDDASAALLASRAGERGHGWVPPVPERAGLPNMGITIDEAMDALLHGGGEGLWDAERGCILVDCDGASDDEMLRMQKTVYVEHPEVGGIKFEPVKVDAKILPTDGEDAKRWACRLLAIMAVDYVTREGYARLAEDIKGRLPGFDIRMGDKADHIPGGGGAPRARGSAWRFWTGSRQNARQGQRPASARGQPRLFWLIQAMEDWDI